MCNDCNKLDEQRMVENEKAWLELKKHITEADKIFLKVFGIYVKIDKQYHTDLILGFGAGLPRVKHSDCPDYDYSVGVLYINNVW